MKKKMAENENEENSEISEGRQSQIRKINENNKEIKRKKYQWQKSNIGGVSWQAA